MPTQRISSSTSSSSFSKAGLVIDARVFLDFKTIDAIDVALAADTHAVELANEIGKLSIKIVDANDKKWRASCAAAKAIEDDAGTNAIASIHHAGHTMNIERSPRSGPYPWLRLVIKPAPEKG